MGNISLCRELSKAQIDGLILDQDHVEYDKYRRTWNGLVDRRPGAIVQARNVDDVTKTVKIAADQGAGLAVRCGGHSFPGHSTCDEGIVLDLSLLNQVAVDSAGCVAEVGGGALLGDLDAAGAPTGLVTPAGVVSHTGVAGLTLGGGMGWLSRRFGLTIDNLLGAEVVTADGRLIWASADSEPDLFWGLRGGGGNFGVVTKFKFRMHPLGPVMVGRWVYALRDSAKVLHLNQELASAAPRELTTAFTVTAAGLALTSLWSGAPATAEAAIAPYGKLAKPLTAMLESVSFLDLQSRNDDHFSWGRRYYAKGGFLQNINNTAIECLSEAIAGSPTPDSEIYVLQLGGAITEVAEDATAYSGRSAGFYWIVEPVWDEAADDVRCLAWGREAAKNLAVISMQGNYVNEQADFGKDVAMNAYGAKKYDRLARLKARFDPQNLFRLNQNIEPRP